MTNFECIAFMATLIAFMVFFYKLAELGDKSKKK
jgi:hypothetical protein